MRIVLTVTCFLGIASLAVANQNNNQNNNQFKKKGGGGNAQQQPVMAPQTGKKFKTGPSGAANVQNFQQQNTGTQFKHNKFSNQTNTTTNFNISKSKKFKTTGQTGGQLNTSAANTTFNKTKNVNVNKNLTVNKNFKFQKKQFNLQTNNKQYVINKYKTVNFNQNYKIAGASKWKGSKYSVFVNYHPQWHDTWWWNWHHPHVTFIYGGWYYWDNNYWYPAWGYAPDSVYYVDAPIYSSSPAEDPAQTVANVQSALQEQGFYQGDIDGVLGPQTRAALAEFQSQQGLEPTGLVDEPTLETLGMA